MTKIKLYHGTNIENAQNIMKNGFKDRGSAKKSNWNGKLKSQKGFIYLTRAYPFFYASNASENNSNGIVIQVEVDEKNLYPDEDFLRFNKVEGKIDLENYKQYSQLSLEKLGNVAIKPKDIEKIIGMKEFSIGEMIMYSDPSMSPLNYQILGSYYRELTDNWWNGLEYKTLKHFNINN